MPFVAISRFPRVSCRISSCWVRSGLSGKVARSASPVREVRSPHDAHSRQRRRVCDLLPIVTGGSNLPRVRSGRRAALRSPPPARHSLPATRVPMRRWSSSAGRSLQLVVQHLLVECMPKPIAAPARPSGQTVTPRSSMKCCCAANTSQTACTSLMVSSTPALTAATANVWPTTLAASRTCRASAVSSSIRRTSNCRTPSGHPRDPRLEPPRVVSIGPRAGRSGLAGRDAQPRSP